MSIIPEPRRLRQEVQDFKAALGYTVDFRVARVGYSMSPVSRNGNNYQILSLCMLYTAHGSLTSIKRLKKPSNFGQGSGY